MQQKLHRFCLRTTASVGRRPAFIVVAKAEVSKSEKTKTELKQTTDSNAAHSIATLLDDRSTLSLNSA